MGLNASFIDLQGFFPVSSDYSFTSLAFSSLVKDIRPTIVLNKSDGERWTTGNARGGGGGPGTRWPAPPARSYRCAHPRDHRSSQLKQQQKIGWNMQWVWWCKSMLFFSPRRQEEKKTRGIHHFGRNRSMVIGRQKEQCRQIITRRRRDLHGQAFPCVCPSCYSRHQHGTVLLLTSV